MNSRGLGETGHEKLWWNPARNDVMVMARFAIPVIIVACIGGASLLFPSAIRPVGQVAGRLVSVGPTEADAPSAGQAGGATNSSGSARSLAASRPAAPIAVSVSQARKAPFPIVVRTFGAVQSPAVVVVGARIASQVVSINVKDGQMVKSGDLLLSLDDRTVQAQLARDKAILSKDSALLVGATADMNRARDLAAKQAGTQQAYDDALAAQQSAQATVDADKATIDADQLQLEFTKITAPIDGRLGAVQVSVGDLVGGGSSSASGGTPTAGLVTVTQIDPIEVIFHLPESNLQIFKAMLDGGTPPRINALVSGTEKIIASGVLDFIDSSVDTTSDTITMRGVFENAKAALWPGQYVDLEIEQGVIADATVIPTVAIQPGQNGQFVYVVKDDDTIEVRPVDVALSDGGLSAINSGLGPGDKVVTEGQQRLKPGAVVTPSLAAMPDQAADANPPPQPGGPGPRTSSGQ